MIEQTSTQTDRRTQTKPLSAAAIALIRIAYDAVILSLALIELFRSASSGLVMGINATVFYALISGLILLTSISAFLIIRRGREKFGIEVLIYGLVIGMFITAIFIENVGSFGLIITIFFTLLAISQGYKFREGILPFLVTILLGVGGLAFDTLFEGAAFRYQLALGMGAVWIPTLIFSALVIFLLARQFSIFSLRAKLISSIVSVAALSLTLLLLFNVFTLEQILTDEADEALFAAASQTSASIGTSLITISRRSKALPRCRW